MTSYRNTASFGKRQEYIAVAELLKRGLDVYMTLVDDQQIDCVIRSNAPTPSYLDIQIKARSKEAKNSGYFASITISNPRDNYVFLFYDESINTYWVIPSTDVVTGASIGKSGGGEGKYSIRLINNQNKKPRPKWAKYINNFELLEAHHA